MIRPVNRFPKQIEPMTINKFFGMDTTGTRDVRRSPDMMNCFLDDEGTPEMRCGYEKEFAISLGAGPILGIHKWLTPAGEEQRIIHHGTKLYLSTGLGAQPAQIYDGMGGVNKSSSFRLANKVCILDGSAFVVYDGTSVTSIETNAYIPTRFIGRTPTGGGTLVEDLNLLQPRWKESFTTEAGQKTYQLSDTALDAVEWVKLGGATKTVTTDYTVDLATGKITLVADPGNGAANNLEVQLKKTRTGYADRIKKCRFAVTYGGANDSRVFVSGNPEYPHMDWWTGLPLSGAYDPTYWPDTNYERIGGDNDPVKGYAIQFDRLTVLKRNSVFLRSAEVTVDEYGRTTTRFPSFPLISGVGCTGHESIQLINNKPVFQSDDGVHDIYSTAIRDERDSNNISPLVKIPVTGSGASIDFDGKYYLAVGDDTVWVCDYNRLLKNEADSKYVPVWYPWCHMPVSCWYGLGGDLLFGSNVDGMIYRMKKKDEVTPYNDLGEAIAPCYYKTVFTTFDRDYMTKLVHRVTIRMKSASHAEMQIKYNTEELHSDTIHVERIDLFDFNDFDFANFSFITSNYPQGFAVRIDDARDIQMFQLVLESSGRPNEFFGMASMDIAFTYLAQIN